MRKTSLVALYALALSGIAADVTAKKPDSLKILMIGNSFSEQMVPSGRDGVCPHGRKM